MVVFSEKTEKFTACFPGYKRDGQLIVQQQFLIFAQDLRRELFAEVLRQALAAFPEPEGPAPAVGVRGHIMAIPVFNHVFGHPAALLAVFAEDTAGVQLKECAETAQFFAGIQALEITLGVGYDNLQPAAFE